MDVTGIRPIPVPVPVPVTLSNDERKNLETRYSDLLLEHTYTTPCSPERRELRKHINEVAAQLGIPKEKVRADIYHYERTRKQVRSIRVDHRPDSRFGPDSGYFG